MKKFADLSDEVIDDVALCPLAKELKVSPSQLIAFGDTPIARLNFSKRTLNGLNRRKLATIGQILKVTDNYLNDTPNLGQKSIREIKSTLRSYLNSATVAAKEGDGVVPVFQIQVHPNDVYNSEVLKKELQKEISSWLKESLRKDASQTSDVARTSSSVTSSFQLSQILNASPEQILKISDVSVSKALFSNRTYNCLTKKGIGTIGVLLATSEDELYNIRNFGDKSMTEIKLKLEGLLTNRISTDRGRFDDAADTQVGSVDPSIPLSSALGALPEQIKNITDIPISKALFSNRTYNCLTRQNIETIGMLLKISGMDLYNIRNMGGKSINEIESLLHKLFVNSSYTLPEKVKPKGLRPRLLGDVLGYSDEDIQKVANFPVSKLVNSKRAKLRLQDRQFKTVSQLLSISQSDLRRKYNLSNEVVREIRGCLNRLLPTIQKKKPTIELYKSRDARKHEKLQSNLPLYQSILAFREPQDTQTHIEDNEEEALHEPLPLLIEVNGENVLDACEELCRDREWAIIVARCGLNANGQSETLQEISKAMEVSRERIRQMETAGLNRIAGAGGIISAFHKTLVWLFEQNEEILNIEHASVELQKYFSPGDVSFDNLCLLFCKAFPEFETVARAASQKVSGAMPPTEGPIFALENQGDDFATVIETARKLWIEREKTIKSDEWLGQVVDALNERGEHLNSDYVLACLRADGRFDPNRFDAAQKLPTLKLALVETLQRMGAPAHFTDICAKLNQLELLDRVANENSTHSCLGQYADLFVCIDQGTYGLLSWGLEDQRMTRDRSVDIADLIEDFLQKRDEPTKGIEIVEYVMQQKECRDFSVSQRLVNDPKFRRTAPGVYGLSKWYFGDAIDVKLPTIKSTVAEALKRIGTPAHIREITERLNQDQLMDRDIPQERVGVCLNSQRDTFVRVGMGIYGLASWGFEDKRITRDSSNIADMAETFLETHNGPATVKEIADYVTKQLECKDSAVNGALSRDARFRNTSRGVYGLERWFF